MTHKASIGALSAIVVTVVLAGAATATAPRLQKTTLTISPASPIAGRQAVATAVSDVRGRHVLALVRGPARRSVAMTPAGRRRFRARFVIGSAGRWVALVRVGKRELVRRAVVVRPQPPPGGEPVDARFQEWKVTAASHPHDVAPAADGTVWYTEQFVGRLARLDPRTGAIRRISLGTASAPHGVIVGPDGAAWVTDQGLNAIVRVDATTEQVRVYAMPAGTGVTAPNTGCFDARGRHWFTGAAGFYGVVDPENGSVRVWPAPRGAGPYGMACAPSGVYYASLQGSYVGRIDPQTGDVTVLDPPTRSQGARRIWADSRGRVWFTEWNAGQLGRYDPSTGGWREWHLPGSSSQPYAVYVDERDTVWITDFGLDALVRFDPATEQFQVFPWPTRSALVRQLLGRGREIWGAESAQDKLVVFRDAAG
jgi:virginiamycin B lyase